MLLLSLGVCTTHVHTVHTNGNKLVIFTDIALYYGDIYMAFTMYTMYVACGHVHTCIRLLGKQITAQEQSCMLAYMTVLLLHALTLSKIERYAANHLTCMYM